jgi:hypothetical protein
MAQTANGLMGGLLRRNIGRKIAVVGTMERSLCSMGIKPSKDDTTMVDQSVLVAMAKLEDYDNQGDGDSIANPITIMRSIMMITVVDHHVANLSACQMTHRRPKSACHACSLHQGCDGAGLWHWS